MPEKVWQIDLLGVLPERSGAVFENGINELQFQIQILSKVPGNHLNVKTVFGFAGQLKPYGFEDKPVRDQSGRIARLKSFLKDYFLIFHPVRVINVSPEKREYYQATHIRLVKKNENWNESLRYERLPLLSRQTHGYTWDGLIHKLWSREFVGQVKNFSDGDHDVPPFLIWENEDQTYHYQALGEFTGLEHAHGGYRFHFRHLKSVSVPDHMLEQAVIGPTKSDQVMFLPISETNELRNRMDLAGETVHVPSVPAEPDANISPSMRETAASRSVPHSAATSVADKTKTATGVPFDEQEFIRRFSQTTRAMGLLYDEKDLVNFHTAMKASRLVILAGMSGTGKSKLVEAYARALGLGDDQYLFIPVRPSWSDDADLIGFVDTVNRTYRPGDSGLVNLLAQAAKPENRREKLYIVCFDEMNLARVEHYFSQFLSVLEMDPPHRKLRLYNEKMASLLDNAGLYPPEIGLDDNVLFVGTVNLDESTCHFSDKVLDRANVITLNHLPFSELRRVRGQEAGPVSSGPVGLPVYRSFRNQDPSLSLTDREIGFFEQIHFLLQERSRNLGVGYRIIQQIDLYLKNLPAGTPLSRNEAFDLQFTQRILTKLRGPEDLLKPLVGTAADERVEGSKLLEVLDAYGDVSRFEKSRAVIREKAKEIRIYGYTM